ncbi:histidine utilization repressor [Rhabdaerophilum calidifontis]|uniref:histidine utilization repressor n=1 Tax=Rhabdaerophilum calidifontis TaxID=2604328 RepID=UPI00123A9472|nr:histidine utilization repressor [Rhabdaerophilum calidifontis]
MAANRAVGKGGAAPLPRYLEIQRDLSAEITSGTWGPGSRVPPEHELQARYQCSRMTVNKALSALAHAGLIVRRRRSGSFVASPTSQQMVLKIHDIQAEVAAAGMSYRFEILDRLVRRPDAEDRARLGRSRSGGRVLALTLVHFANGTPFVHEERLIDLLTVPEAEAEDFSAAPPGSWLLNRVAWTDAEHVIAAIPAEARIAKALAIARKSACLQIERRTWQGGVPVTWALLTYPGDRHRLTSRFGPAQGLMALAAE